MTRFRPTLALPLALGLALAAAALPASTDAPAPTGPSRPSAGAFDRGLDRTAPRAAPATVAPRPTGAVAAATSRPKAPHPAVASSLVAGSVNRSTVRMSTAFDVALNLNFGTRVVTVDATLSATNTSGSPIDRLDLNTIAARLGAMRLTHASVEGVPVAASVVDQTIAVPLGGILETGSTVQARIAYRATLRSDVAGSNWLFTRANGIADLYRWIPWPSKKVPFDRPNHGDPFVTANSPRVTVKITTDRPLVLATTGERIAVDGLTQTFEARNVRDFTVAAATDFKTGSRVVGDTTVRVWYRPGFPATAAVDQAARALARMGSLLAAPYPYRQFKVVQSAGGYGMESPGLIWIPTGVSTSNLTYLVHHETAHQWFYGIVGGDQANEPFTDEAAADFLARYALGTRRASRCSTARLDLSIYRYSASCYYEIVYIQGGNFLDDLRRRMGSTAFWKGLRAYVAGNRFALVGTKTLLNTLDAHTTLDLVPRYEPRFPRIY